MYVDDGDAGLSDMKKAIETAQSVLDKPSIIKIKTTIGFGSKNQGKEKVHGAPLGPDDIKAVKEKFGFNPDASFEVSGDVYQHYRELVAANDKVFSDWSAMFEKYKSAYPDLV